MIITRKVMAFAAIVIWLILLTVGMIYMCMDSTNTSNQPTQVGNYDPHSNYGSDDSDDDPDSYTQAPDKSGDCTTYDGDYTNDECP